MLDMPVVNWLTVVVSTAISAPVVAGLLGWLGNKKLADDLAKHNRDLDALRAQYARELEADKSRFVTSHEYLRAEIEKTVLVSRVHFETEFQALKLVFQELAKVRLRISGLRPFFNIRPENETKEDKMKQLVEAVNDIKDAFNQLIETSENLSPFYPPEIYDQIQECQRATMSEINDIQLTTSVEGFTPGWYLRAEKNQREFLKAYRAVSTLIRDRISRLAVVRSV